MSGTIGFLLHPAEHESVGGALEAAARRGFKVWTTVEDPGRSLAERAAETDLLVTVGGDGTFLFGARLAAPRDIPVLGVNRGRLGFLTDVEVVDLPEAIENFAERRFHLQRRAMVSVDVVLSHGDTRKMLALNDVAVKAHGVSVARLHVDADDELFGEFDADGIVVATATGSTAYALSAGGPPMDPRVPAIVVVPLAPHAVITRAVVLPEMTVVRITVRHGQAFIGADGLSLGTLGEGGSATVSPGPGLSLVRFPHSPTFLRRLRDKLHFGTPLKDADHTANSSVELETTA